MSGEPVVIVRENWWGRYEGLAWIIPLGICALFACSLFWGKLLGLFPLALGLLLVVPAVRAQRLALLVDDDTVIIRNPWVTYRVPIREVTEVGYRHRFGRWQRRFLSRQIAYRVFVRRGGRRIYANATESYSYDEQGAIVARLSALFRERRASAARSESA